MNRLNGENINSLYLDSCLKIPELKPAMKRFNPAKWAKLLPNFPAGFRTTYFL